MKRLFHQALDWSFNRGVNVQMNKYSLVRQKTLSELCQKKDEQIEFLWSLLDDISTAGDMFKPEINGYFKYVNARCERRSEVAYSEDGQTLKIKGFCDS